MAEDTWALYEAAYKAIAPKLAEFMAELAHEFDAEATEDINGDNYGYFIPLVCEDMEYLAEFRLVDASDYEKTEPGRQGNLLFTVCRNDGRIIVSWAPHQFSPECWVPYTDQAAFCARIPSLSAIADIRDAIFNDAI